MKTLLVLRHAKSSWNDPARDDHERPLNKRGRRDGPRMGELVREYGLLPDLVISSDAVRARLTAEAMAEAARYAGEVLLDQHLYLASPAEILSRLRAVRESAGTVMIVGHNPGLEELNLARGARFNPTAFQAVSFQPPTRVNGGWGGRVSPKRARGDGS
jgi:phosphohistidine phosphatase